TSTPSSTSSTCRTPPGTAGASSPSCGTSAPNRERENGLIGAYRVWVPTYDRGTRTPEGGDDDHGTGFVPGAVEPTPDTEGEVMTDTNRGVVYQGPGKVTVENLDYPELVLTEQNRPLQHGAILKVLATNICGSDQHMVRGRTTAPAGLTLGHEITGEVVEVGRDVEFIKEGDLVSVPFNIACGRCRNCKERNTGVCENVNPARAGA